MVIHGYTCAPGYGAFPLLAWTTKHGLIRTES